jgi:hypothetical protein
MLPIVVVDVGGDHLNPSHTRELVEKELSVTAVAPDDPRAATATGRIEMTGKASDHSLTVKYRKVDEAIERTIALPEDPSRAESEAVFLVGNLARDEASELAPQPKEKPKTERPASVAATLWNEDDRELARLHAFVTESTKEENSKRVRTGLIEIGAGATLLAPAVYLWSSGDSSTEARAFRSVATIYGGTLIGVGIATSFIASDPLEPIARKVREHEAKGTPASAAIADIEKEWAKQADAAHSGRIVFGWFSIALGALAVTGGSILAVTGQSDSHSETSTTFIAAGSICALYGIASLASDSEMESSYHLWQAMKTPREPGTQVSFGAGPLPGGGGAASFALTF